MDAEAHADRPASFRTRAARYSTVQRRTIATALDLFADRGVGGTSLQMIADALGVTKAAVYHQFRTKEAIANAVIEVELAHLEAALEDAEAAGGGRDARRRLLAEVIDGAVARRRAVSTVQSDPTLLGMLGSDPTSRRLWARLFAMLLGGELDDERRVHAAVLSAAIGAVAHPFVADLDDDALRAHLSATAERLVAGARRSVRR